MITSYYLVISKSGRVEAKKQKPTLHAKEVAVRIEIDIEDKFFDQPLAQAKLRLDDSNIELPEVNVIAMDRLLE